MAGFANTLRTIRGLGRGLESGMHMPKKVRAPQLNIMRNTRELTPRQVSKDLMIGLGGLFGTMAGVHGIAGYYDDMRRKKSPTSPAMKKSMKKEPLCDCGKPISKCTCDGHDHKKSTAKRMSKRMDMLTQSPKMPNTNRDIRRTNKYG